MTYEEKLYYLELAADEIAETLRMEKDFIHVVAGRDYKIDESDIDNYECMLMALDEAMEDLFRLKELEK